MLNDNEKNNLIFLNPQQNNQSQQDIKNYNSPDLLTPLSNGQEIPVIRMAKPKQRPQSLVKRAISRIFFPPILFWDALKYTVSSLAGEAVGKMFVPPSRQYLYADLLETKFRDLNLSPSLSAEKLIVETFDKAALNTFIIKQKSYCNTPIDKQQYLVNFIGKGMCYESIIDEMEEDAKALHCNVVAFNFRGVGLSTKRPKSKKDLVTDGIAQIQRLLDLGVPANNITLKGYSLGGGISTLVAKHFFRRGVILNLFNDRSYSSITNYMVGQIRTKLPHRKHTGHIEPFWNRVLGAISKPFLKLALLLTGWEINAAKAFRTLPKDHKAYTVVRSPRWVRQKYGEHVIDDPIITYYASMHHGLKHERRREKNKLDKAYQLLSMKPTNALIQSKLKKAQEQIKTARLNFKENKMAADDAGQNGHRLKNSEIYDQVNHKSSQAYFWHFFRKVHPESYSQGQYNTNEVKQQNSKDYPAVELEDIAHSLPSNAR